MKPAADEGPPSFGAVWLSGSWAHYSQLPGMPQPSLGNAVTPPGCDSVDNMCGPVQVIKAVWLLQPPGHPGWAWARVGKGLLEEGGWTERIGARREKSTSPPKGHPSPKDKVSLRGQADLRLNP